MYVRLGKVYTAFVNILGLYCTLQESTVCYYGKLELK